MKKKTENKVEMKEKVLSGNALALDDADLEGAAGGLSMEERRQAVQEYNQRGQQEQQERAEENLAWIKEQIDALPETESVIDILNRRVPMQTPTPINTQTPINMPQIGSEE